MEPKHCEVDLLQSGSVVFLVDFPEVVLVRFRQHLDLPSNGVRLRFEVMALATSAHLGELV